jgi:hypothetical protein
MTEKSVKRVFEKKNPTNSSDISNIKRGRGRPKGAKNKPKVESVPTVAKKRGRPKGSKNKVKTSSYQEIQVKGKYLNPIASAKPEIARIPKPPGKRGRPRKNDNPLAASSVKKEEQKAELPTTSGNHPLFPAVAWLEKNMHHNELQYYRSRAHKIGSTIQVAIASDILGFFNVQDAEICKQIKKNTFIASVTKHELH